MRVRISVRARVRLSVRPSVHLSDSIDEKRHFPCSDEDEIRHGPTSVGQFIYDIKM